MQIKIQNKLQNYQQIKTTINQSFDLVSNTFFQNISTKSTLKVPIFKFKNFSIFWCIVCKNNQQYVRFVQFNLKKQQFCILFEVHITKLICLNLITNSVFLLTTKDEKTITMHTTFLDGEAQKNFVRHFKKVFKITIIKKQKFLVHSIENDFFTLTIFDLKLNKLSTIFSSNKKFFCKLNKEQIFVFDDNKKILKIFKISQVF